MENEKDSDNCGHHRHRWRGNGGGGGAVYGMGFIGSAIYFLMHSTYFWGGVLGVLKAAIWPALLAFKAFEMLKM
jgi:hypothetical protein